jgi:HEAT repeat protein
MLEREDDNQRGDVAYLLGHIGDATVLGSLEVSLNDANTEVAEAACEAIQQIRERESREREPRK